MIYVYALIATPAVDLSVFPVGIRNPLAVIGQNGLYGVVEPDAFEEGLPQADQVLLDAVLQHDRIVQGLFQQTPVLPLRFGSQFLDGTQLAAYLAEHGALYREQLQQFQDQAEFTLSFTPRSVTATSAGATTSAPEPPKGREYFLAKKQRLLAENDRLQVQQSQWLSLQQSIQRAYPHCLWSDPENPRAYLLVSFKREPHLHKQVQQWEQTYSEWEIEVSVPLPPYHFVTME
jgi:hypothetical protein